jgi:hypothetical protein
VTLEVLIDVQVQAGNRHHHGDRDQCIPTGNRTTAVGPGPSGLPQTGGVSNLPVRLGVVLLASGALVQLAFRRREQNGRFAGLTSPRGPV